MKAQPNCPAIIRKMESCLKKGGYVFSRGEAIYDRLMSRHDDKLVVNDKNNVVEQRMLKWTTYANIHAWLDTLKGFFIEFGFACESTNEDMTEGKLVYFESHTHRILNLDESKASTDGTTTKISGGFPPILSSSDMTLPRGATTAKPVAR